MPTRAPSRLPGWSAGAPLVGSLCGLAGTAIHGCHRCWSVKNRRISSLHSFVVERVMMLLNVGIPTSAIQLIVCVFPIDAIDGCGHATAQHPVRFEPLTGRAALLEVVLAD
jgi:hypothetical protein